MSRLKQNQNKYNTNLDLSLLAAQLKLHRSARGEWRGSCPSCGYGHEAFVLTAGKRGPVGWCASCQDKNAIAEILRTETGLECSAPTANDEQAKAQARIKKTEKARGIWNGATSIIADDPAGKYLTSRHIQHLIGVPSLRYRSDVQHPSQERWPGLVALVQDVAGQPVAIHRTFLTMGGAKAHIEPQKATLGPVLGAAIRLAQVAEEIVVGEGIESSAAAGLLLNLPAWAAISAGNLASGLVLPPEVRRVVIAADHDAPGIKSAEDAARRWTAEGRAVRIVKPDEPGVDFADLLMRRGV